MEETETVIDIIDISRELYDLKNKYERLKEGHRKLLIVNQNLEEKLLQNINKYETEKFSMVHTISSLNHQLEEFQRINKKLERFKLDISVAIQLLHCKPSSFSECKLENLPQEFQDKAKFHMQQEFLPRYKPEKKGKVIRVPISAFPSTTVIYSIPDDNDDDGGDINTNTTVPVETMAKVLNERQLELYDQSINGSSLQLNCNNGLHSSHSMSFMDNGLQYVDHGTQTYPNFIGEREKTRNTCIFCQGEPSTNRPESIKSQSNLPLGDPKVFVYTESEISPVTVRSTSNSSKKNAANTHRRKVLANSSSVSPSYSRSSMETDI
ncbi:uncharacterized protein LOC124208227 isoform X2 [Daphnia pulex]|uniref:uncharacterized protein LOC124208227 isoform X2 n=1 Tax=Daphnia pulex TaxID=6669 RepID=UPI001EDE887F|nr:uncharacterized protein LOC124208227 isoform X2 [Daphnia pulex]XP_046653129.1 uncharacterized protein LOC124343720 isoform X2 [Daphnia pulicaria]